MPNKEKMSPEELRRYRRRVEQRRRERLRVRRNRQILGGFLIIIGVLVVVFGVKTIGKHLPKKSKSNKTKVVQTTKHHETQSIETTEKTSYKVNDKYSKLKTDKLTVCIDPGHGGKDKGHENGDVVESKQMLEMAKQVSNDLSAYGVNVVLTREDDSFLYLNPRSQVANDNKADVFVSLHRNEDTASGDTSGIELYIDKDADKDTTRLATALYKRIKKVSGMDISKTKYGSKVDEDTNYVVIDGVTMPACLIYFGYVSNSSDNQAFAKNMSKYSSAVTEGILTYLLKKQEEENTIKETEEETYDESLLP